MKNYFFIAFMIMTINAIRSVIGTDGNKNILHEAATVKLNCNHSSLASSNSRIDNLETIIDQMGKEMTELKLRNEYLDHRVQVLESTSEKNPKINAKKSRTRRASRSSVSLDKKKLSRFYEFPDKLPGNSNLVPNSCNDLQLMVHNLNGFYSVQGRDENANRIETIFCNFSDILNLKSAQTNLQGKNEKRVGFLDIKTRPIYFYVQKTTDFSQSNERVPFEVEYLNIGKAFNRASSVFTAPVNGIYTFSFSSLKAGSFSEVNVYLRLNSKPVGLAYATGSYQHIPVVMQSTLKLKVGDTIDMWLSDGDLRDHAGHHTHFIGWLQEEELTFGK